MKWFIIWLFMPLVEKPLSILKYNSRYKEIWKKY